ncbi:MAG: aldo/keto reductase [Pseudoruegeria sp.]
MRQLNLGRSDLKVSELCLGSMTWGTQNTQKEGHTQIEMALDYGVNFIDTAEMYPVNPVQAETVGVTEAIIGEWVAQSGRRNEVVIATKHSGLNERFVRPGQPITAATMHNSVEASLKRLKTDVIDLYQLHWPNRGSYHFRQIWDYDPSQQNRAEIIDNIGDVLGAMKELQATGKVREFGLSNESAWGTMQWLIEAEKLDAPRMQAIQNEYSLVCRQFDSDLAELSFNEDVTLLAFSPLATGMLTGKYKGGTEIPKGSRRTYVENLGGRVTDLVWPAVQAYTEIAQKHGLDPSQMAIAWCMSRPFKTIPIFGAVTEKQLKLALGSVDVALNDEVLADIIAAHRCHPMPF